MKKNKTYSILFILLLNTFFALGQNDTSNVDTKLNNFKIIEKGFLVGYGYGLDNLSNIPEGNYRPIFLIYKLGRILPKLEKNIKNGPLKFRLYSEYQIIPVMLFKNNQTQWEFEIGNSNGIQFIYKLNSKLEIYGLIGSGLHYFSTKTVRQKRGLIFSDNMDAGIYYNTKNDWSINFAFRIRHMSNANIWMPNHGINTSNFLIGLSKNIK
ncbi:MAG: hypothetical protein RLZZ175_637 [Bacteroidota bacterium]|jgi:hypothetical protein